jgi:hypothetical protein
LFKPLPRGFECPPCFQERETKPAKRLEPSGHRADLEKRRRTKLLAQRENSVARTDAERTLQVEGGRLRTRSRLLDRLERVPNARRNGRGRK